MASGYIASKTRSGRPGWSVTFRHPVRTDSRNQRGLKIRKGLGTADDAQADEYVRQLNELLADQSWWSGDRREDARQREFAPVVISIFFDGIETIHTNSHQIRDEIIPLPSLVDGYTRTLLLGTTGAGKTTLLRHLIGTTNEESFPSTSTAKTTTADIEIITREGSFEAAVTFLPDHEVRAYIDECVEAACLEAVQDRKDEKIVGALLQHEEQRFRLSYVLGSWQTVKDVDEADFSFSDAVDEDEGDDERAVTTDERASNHRKLLAYLDAIKTLTTEVRQKVEQDVGPLQAHSSAEDRAAWLELFGNEIYSAPQVSEVSLDILDEVTGRFEHVKFGEIVRGATGWPSLWTFSNDDRETFLRQVRWFSSNHHQQFGRLLTPLVDGIRVRGPFFPSQDISEAKHKLVLIDGEGIGHAAANASSISTRITQRFEEVDLILLVDNAQQPMQAAPLALLRSVGSSGFSKKLVMAFTHFDLVRGANLGSFEQRRDHVAGSIRNAVGSLRDFIGAGIAGALERQIDKQSTFLGGLDRDSNKLPTGFRRELSKLLDCIHTEAPLADQLRFEPVYQFKGLEIAMRDAIETFRQPWRARLGLGTHETVAKEHWTRIKALSRRLANDWEDEYSNLRPIADLLSSLQEEAAKWLDRPSEWTTEPKTEDDREASLDPIRQSVFVKLGELVRKRLKDDQLANWRIAFDFKGKGSATQRADMINEIQHDAAPHMSASMTQHARDFLDTLYDILRDSIESSGGKVKAL